MPSEQGDCTPVERRVIKQSMEQDDLTPAARQLLNDQERLKSEWVKLARTAAHARVEKLRAETEARESANDESET